MPSDVKLLLSGLLILSAKPGRRTGTVSVIKNAPEGHKLTIRIKKIPPSGPAPRDIVLTREELERTLDLQIETATPEITIPNSTPVNRHTSDPSRSFMWVVDLERPSELYKSGLGFDPEELEPILKFNSGALFTVDTAVSMDPLLVQRGVFSRYVPLGRVALTIGIESLGATRVLFKNGESPVFDSNNELGTKYIIQIVHDAEEHPAIVTDANHYYHALGRGIPAEQKILFMSLDDTLLLRDRLKEAERVKNEKLAAAIKSLLDLRPPIGPEAACFPAYLGRTEVTP